METDIDKVKHWQYHDQYVTKWAKELTTNISYILLR